MNKSRLELKVGFFVLVCLVLTGALMLQFSKGTTFFRKTYTIQLKSANVGGLKPRASVLMSGVQIGTVHGTVLESDGKSVTVSLRIYSQFGIHKDARFSIEQFGFLGDQYVAIYPTENRGVLLGDQAVVTADEPFNLQEAAKSATGFIKRVDATAKKLDDAVNDIRRLVLNEKTLGDIAATAANLRQVSEDARGTVRAIDRLVVSNEVPAGLAVSNLVQFSDRLNVLAQSAQAVLTTNTPALSAAFTNLQTSTSILTNLLADLQAGKGLAGGLLKDDRLSGDVARIAGNLSVTSSNLNRLGLWRLLFPKTPREPAPAPEAGPVQTNVPKRPF